MNDLKRPAVTSNIPGYTWEDYISCLAILKDKKSWACLNACIEDGYDPSINWRDLAFGKPQTASPPKIYKTGPKPSVHECRASVRGDNLLDGQPPLNILELVERSNEYAVRNGFWDHAVLKHVEGDYATVLKNPSIVPEKIALTHSELSEALESFRAGEPILWFTEKGKPEGVASELADAVIRICDLARHLGVDLEEAIAIKGAYNNTRPFKHGKAF